MCGGNQAKKGFLYRRTCGGELIHGKQKTLDVFEDMLYNAL
jgi:hypothetical protein